MIEMLENLVFWCMAVSAILFWAFSIPMFFAARDKDDGFAQVLALTGWWVLSKQRYKEDSWKRFGVGRFFLGATLFFGTAWVLLNAI